MSAALKTPELPPEAIALIKEGTPKPLVEKRVPEAPVQSGAGSRDVETEFSPPEAPAARVTRARPVVQREVEAARFSGTAHLSVRLPAEMPQALLRASLDRKLRRVKPWTQQDIVADALMAWLKRNGYSVPGEP
jgi:hypothetical protein